MKGFLRSVWKAGRGCVAREGPVSSSSAFSHLPSPLLLPFFQSYFCGRKCIGRAQRELKTPHSHTCFTSRVLLVRGKWWYLLHVCVSCVHMCVCVVCTCVCRCRSQHVFCPATLHPISVTRCPWIWSQADSQQTSETLLSLVPNSAGVAGMIQPCRLFMWVLRPRLIFT